MHVGSAAPPLRRPNVAQDNTVAPEAQALQHALGGGAIAMNSGGSALQSGRSSPQQTIQSRAARSEQHNTRACQQSCPGADARVPQQHSGRHSPTERLQHVLDSWDSATLPAHCGGSPGAEAHAMPPATARADADSRDLSHAALLRNEHDSPAGWGDASNSSWQPGRQSPSQTRGQCKPAAPVQSRPNPLGSTPEHACAPAAKTRRSLSPAASCPHESPAFGGARAHGRRRHQAPVIVSGHTDPQRCQDHIQAPPAGPGPVTQAVAALLASECSSDGSEHGRQPRSYAVYSPSWQQRSDTGSAAAASERAGGSIEGSAGRSPQSAAFRQDVAGIRETSSTLAGMMRRLLDLGVPGTSSEPSNSSQSDRDSAAARSTAGDAEPEALALQAWQASAFQSTAQSESQQEPASSFTEAQSAPMTEESQRASVSVHRSARSTLDSTADLGQARLTDSGWDPTAEPQWPHGNNLAHAPSLGVGDLLEPVESLHSKDAGAGIEAECGTAKDAHPPEADSAHAAQRQYFADEQDPQQAPRETGLDAGGGSSTRGTSLRTTADSACEPQPVQLTDTGWAASMAADAASPRAASDCSESSTGQADSAFGAREATSQLSAALQDDSALHQHNAQDEPEDNSQVSKAQAAQRRQYQAQPCTVQSNTFGSPAHSTSGSLQDAADSNPGLAPLSSKMTAEQDVLSSGDTYSLRSSRAESPESSLVAAHEQSSLKLRTDLDIAPVQPSGSTAEQPAADNAVASHLSEEGSLDNMLSTAAQEQRSSAEHGNDSRPQVQRSTGFAEELHHHFAQLQQSAEQQPAASDAADHGVARSAQAPRGTRTLAGGLQDAAPELQTAHSDQALAHQTSSDARAALHHHISSLHEGVAQMQTNMQLSMAEAAQPVQRSAAVALCGEPWAAHHLSKQASLDSALSAAAQEQCISVEPGNDARPQVQRSSDFAGESRDHFVQLQQSAELQPAASDVANEGVVPRAQAPRGSYPLAEDLQDAAPALQATHGNAVPAHPTFSRVQAVFEPQVGTERSAEDVARCCTDMQSVAPEPTEVAQCPAAVPPISDASDDAMPAGNASAAGSSFTSDFQAGRFESLNEPSHNRQPSRHSDTHDVAADSNARNASTERTPPQVTSAGSPPFSLQEACSTASSGAVQRVQSSSVASQQSSNRESVQQGFGSSLDGGSELHNSWASGGRAGASQCGEQPRMLPAAVVEHAGDQHVAAFGLVQRSPVTSASQDILAGQIIAGGAVVSGAVHSNLHESAGVQPQTSTPRGEAAVAPALGSSDCSSSDAASPALADQHRPAQPQMDAAAKLQQSEDTLADGFGVKAWYPPGHPRAGACT